MIMNLIKISVILLLISCKTFCFSDKLYSSANDKSLAQQGIEKTDSIRLQYIYMRNKPFFDSVFSILRIDKKFQIYLFAQHCNLKAGFVLWRENDNYDCAYYSLSNNTINTKIRRRVRKQIIQDYFKAFANSDSISRALIDNDIKPSHPCKVDLIYLDQSVRKILTFDIERISTKEQNSKYLLELIKLVMFQSSPAKN